MNPAAVQRRRIVVDLAVGDFRFRLDQGDTAATPSGGVVGNVATVHHRIGRIRVKAPAVVISGVARNGQIGYRGVAVVEIDPAAVATLVLVVEHGVVVTDGGVGHRRQTVPPDIQPRAAHRFVVGDNTVGDGRRAGINEDPAAAVIQQAGVIVGGVVREDAMIEGDITVGNVHAAGGGAADPAIGQLAGVGESALEPEAVPGLAGLFQEQDTVGFRTHCGEHAGDDKLNVFLKIDDGSGFDGKGGDEAHADVVNREIGVLFQGPAERTGDLRLRQQAAGEEE